MFNKFFIGLVASTMFAAVASAQVVRAPLEIYSEGTIKQAKKSGKEIKDEDFAKEQIEALRKTGKFKDADLARIGAKKYSEIDVTTQKKMVAALRASKAFQFRVLGKREGITNEDLGRTMGDAMKRYANKDSGQVSKELLELSKSDIMKATKASQYLNKEVFEALVKADSKTFGRTLNISKKASDRVAKLEAIAKKSGKAEDIQAAAQFKESVSGMIMNQVKSYEIKGLEKDGGLGEGTAKACAEMDKQAIVNLADFFEGGVLEGKDVETFIQGMAKRASKKFDEAVDKSFFRMCALATGPCKMLSKAVAEACEKAGGRMAAAH